ncbi:MAG: hypothetical protein ACOCTT_03800 [archaeon]
MFKPIQYDNGKTKEMAVKDGEDISKGDALQFDSGEVKRATSSTETVRFVSLEDVSSASDDVALCLDVRGVEFKADCANETDQDQVGVGQDLDDHEAIDNNSTAADNCFMVTELVGVAADKKVRGYFLDRNYQS